LDSTEKKLNLTQQKQPFIRNTKILQLKLSTQKT